MNQLEKEQACLQGLPQDPVSVERRENMKQQLLELLDDFCEAFGADGCCIDFDRSFQMLPEFGEEQISPYPRFECTFCIDLPSDALTFAIEYPHPEQEAK